MRALEFIRDHVTFKLPYDFSYQMKTPQVHLRKNGFYFFISGLPRPIFGLYLKTIWSENLEKVSIKRPVLSIFKILEAYNDQVL